MKAPSPAFSLYPKDLLTSENVVAMTDEELGVYVRLLCHQWLEGSIPAEPDRLAKMMKRRRRAFDRIWRAVGPCFPPAPDRLRLLNPRLEEERAKQEARAEVAAVNGRRGGRPQTQPKPSGLANSNPEESFPSPFPSPLVSQMERVEKAKTNQPTNQQARPAYPAVNRNLNEMGPSANPLVAGRRRELEKEYLALVSKLSQATKKDPIEISAKAAGYEGSTRIKTNPADMSDNRLAASLLDLRADWAEVERRLPRPEAVASQGGPGKGVPGGS